MFRLEKDKWIVIRRVSLEDGERDRKRGVLEPLYDGSTFVGYRNRKPKTYNYTPSSSKPSSNVFSRMEVQAIAGLLGDSETTAMSEHERLDRVHRKTFVSEPEDFVEQAEAKLAEWPEMHNDRAIRVYPMRPVEGSR